MASSCILPSRSNVFSSLSLSFAARIVITLVGAGRGPLIVCSLNAAKRTRREIVVYAIEKNPNAIQTLRAMHKQLQWGERVHIVEADMRLYQPEYYSDVILSELLGSFADNELSPECLIGAQRFLLAGGLFVPHNSTSLMACCMSTKIYENVVFSLSFDWLIQ